MRASLLKHVPLAQAELRQLRDDIAPTWLRAPLSVEATAERYVRPQLRQARRAALSASQACSCMPADDLCSTAGRAAPRGSVQLRPQQPCCMSGVACERMAGRQKSMHAARAAAALHAIIWQHRMCTLRAAHAGAQVFVDLCRRPVADYLQRFGFRSDLLRAMYAVTDGVSGLTATWDMPGSGLNFLCHNMVRAWVVCPLSCVTRPHRAMGGEKDALRLQARSQRCVSPWLHKCVAV